MLETAGSSDDEDEDEDEDGDLAPEALDEEIESTLLAIKTQDPRVYENDTMFYSKPSQFFRQTSNDDADAKPLRLSEYHQTNLLHDPRDFAESKPEPYFQQQEKLHDRAIREMNGTGVGSASNSGSGDQLGGDDTFLVKKPLPESNSAKKQREPAMTRTDVETADKNPEAFLSKFLSSRAWVASTSKGLQAFESDNDEDDRQAEEFEEAYNLRFEDPEKANRKLTFHSRAAATSSSVRKESTSKRKRARQEARSRRDLHQMESAQERMRLKNLKMEEIADRLAQFKEASGYEKTTVSIEEWSRFLDEDWDDKRWEDFMRKKFDEKYYAGTGADSGKAEDHEISHVRKKPRWNDDIDVSDLIHGSTPDQGALSVTLPRKLDDNMLAATEVVPKTATAQRPRKERQQRQEIERLVKQKLKTDLAIGAAAAGPGQYCYRETSPSAYGLTVEDILLASDAQLNQYVGLKKLAAFRDPVMKRKDKKRLGKKARLGQWRLETFGALE